MKTKTSILRKLMSAIGILLIVFFAILLAFNVTIIIKGLIHSDVPPSVFGITPMVVKTGSMSSDVQHIVKWDELVDISADRIKALKVGDMFYTQYGDLKVENTIASIQSPDSDTPVFITVRPVKDHIEAGDLIFSKKIDAKELKVGDVISYLENSAVVTHRIIKINNNEDGSLSFSTKGDANNTEDLGDPVPADNLVGVYKARIPALGDFIFFLQKPLGMALFIGIPVLTFIVYDIIRRARSAKKEDNRTEELEKELERLRALAKEQEAKASASGESKDPE
ncbi:MAG: signal peptidase I [Clostridia bacterium]|nr:signal peptidase I [Clostridia bacterium]